MFPFGCCRYCYTGVDEYEVDSQSGVEDEWAEGVKLDSLVSTGRD